MMLVPTVDLLLCRAGAEQFAERVLADEREQAHLHAVEHPAEQRGEECQVATAGRDGGQTHDSGPGGESGRDAELG